MKKLLIIFAIAIFCTAMVANIQTNFNLHGTEVNADPGLDCKWNPDVCPDQTPREVCIDGGTGNECKCGSVTRPC